jgi:hypothetical protein
VVFHPRLRLFERCDLYSISIRTIGAIIRSNGGRSVELTEIIEKFASDQGRKTAALGSLKSLFTQIFQIAQDIFASKNENAPDFEFDQVMIEIGGPNKARKKAGLRIQ